MEIGYPDWAAALELQLAGLSRKVLAGTRCPKGAPLSDHLQVVYSKKFSRRWETCKAKWSAGEVTAALGSKAKFCWGCSLQSHLDAARRLDHIPQPPNTLPFFLCNCTEHSPKQRTQGKHLQFCCCAEININLL